MEFRKITRVTIFVDYDNFTNAYWENHRIREKNITIWDSLTDRLLEYYTKHFIKNEFEIADHTGTYLCVGMSDYFVNSEEKNKKKRFQALDRKNGFIVRYGNRNAPKRNKQGQLCLGEEKGVDAEIICQMLMGAFLNHYDSCILMSDDTDYLPAVSRVQDYFGKKVIQAGYRDVKLRNQAYGHIPLEDMDKNLHETQTA